MLVLQLQLQLQLTIILQILPSCYIEGSNQWPVFSISLRNELAVFSMIGWQKKLMISLPNEQRLLIYM